MPNPSAAALATVVTLAADVLPPPTLVIDFLYLGIPLGLFAGALLLTAVVAVYRRARKRGRGRPLAALFAALVLFAGNLALYTLWISVLRRPHHHFEPPPVVLQPPPAVQPPSPSPSPSNEH